MSSILTNTSAMVALQTLQSINRDLSKTQDEISTGKSVASAKDNSAIWAISKVMEADVNGFKSISESLALGESTVAVARQASETVTDLLTQMKGQVVAAQEENVDRAKIQTGIKNLREQINSVVNAAQFNGLNLLQGTEMMEVLSSLDRASDGTVTANQIEIDRQDLTSTVATYGIGTAVTGQVTASATLSNAANTNVVGISGTIAENDDFTVKVDGQTFTVSAGSNGSGGPLLDANGVINSLVTAINDAGISGINAANNSGVEISSTKAFETAVVEGSTSGAATVGAGGTIVARAEDLAFSNSGLVQEGRSYQVDLGGVKVFYTAGSGDSQQDVAAGLKARIDMNTNLTGIATKVEQIAGVWNLRIDNDEATSVAATTEVKDGGTVGGGLELLRDVDVSTNRGADAALVAIEGLIQRSIDAAAEFGSSEQRIETQSDFIGKLTDALKTGIGALVDADMEEASARLQALQVQQQLGTQSLSIANQQPQNILALFR